MTDPYSTLARFYDQLIEADYHEWVEYLLALASRFRHAPDRVLDLGCGTGSLSIPLAKRGCSLTGVDFSEEMLAAARHKAQALGCDISFLAGDMRSLDLPGQQFDTVISGCDVLNYLTSEDDLLAAFRTVHKLLAPGGLWLFDLNSDYKLREIYGNESYADLQDDFGYFWDNAYDEAEDICTMDLTFFVQVGENLYERRTERHRQKLWTPQEIGEYCLATGFSLLACYDFLSFGPIVEDSEKWQFVIKKI
jgi:ubiquinone/menaquinone biosynthesis C-methylase UbiE